MRRKLRTADRGWTVAITLFLWALPGDAPALVRPLTIIEVQVKKPNLLVLLDTSGSMGFSPGGRDNRWEDVGMDCDGGDHCAQVGQVGRCYYSQGGRMGAGVEDDTTKCTADADCRKGYCKDGGPQACTSDSGCSSGKCQGYCSNNPAKPCTGNSACGWGNKCQGVCKNTLASAKTCATDSDCPSGEPCVVHPNDFCVTQANKVESAKMCKYGQERCYTDLDCAKFADDTCGPATSRMVIAKRVIGSVVANYYPIINFGLMTFHQSGHYPYYPTVGPIQNHDVTRFWDKAQLVASACWTQNDGPAPTCKISGFNYNRRGANDSLYRVKTGGETYTAVESKWCGIFCPLPDGTGHYVGSYYTYTDPQATLKIPLVAKVKPDYVGKTWKEGSTDYLYWDAPLNYYNADGIYDKRFTPFPFSGPKTSSTCCATCGGEWSLGLAPLMDISGDVTKAQQMAAAVIARMDKARYGGMAAVGGTPSGCAMWNNTDGAAKTNNAYSYMKEMVTADYLPCRRNYVLFVTDGHPNQGNDIGCETAECGADDPAAAGCKCHTVLAARELKKLGVQVSVVAYAGAMTTDYPRKTVNNIAKAGGGEALFAVHEEELKTAVVNVVYNAAKGSYSTSPAAASSGSTESSGAIKAGTMLLDTRVDFPGWKGNLIAYDLSSGTPVVAWNAATVSFDATNDPDFWKKRNLWTSNGTAMVKFQIDATTGAITNKAQLKELGLGLTPEEAERVARFLLGDPKMKNPAVLGAMINSTPIDVGPAGRGSQPGGLAFYETHKTRPYLPYVGASDGMLHAFFTKTVTVGGKTYKGGQEAFAYIPQALLGTQRVVFAQGGQLPDPRDHIYGLATSAKVKNICFSACDGKSGTPEWKTVLAMGYGWGGTEVFALDITNPFDAGGVKADVAPAPLLWHTEYAARSEALSYDNALGLATSVPAFYYAKTPDKNDYRIVFGSAYGTGKGQEGKILLNAKLGSGALVDEDTVGAPNSCAHAYGLLSDVASARNYGAGEEQRIRAAYFGDTWGNLYRYVPTELAGGDTGNTGTVDVVESFTCDHPIHFAPAIVQMDRDDPTAHPGKIYVVQVTNSALDVETAAFPPSKLIFRKEIATAGSIQPDTKFGLGGKIEYDLAFPGELCGVTSADGKTCVEPMPAKARPASTPTAVLRSDGQGFQVFSLWYASSPTGCDKGKAYLTIHEVTESSGVSQKAGIKVGDEPITSAVFVGGSLVFASEQGVTDVTSGLPSSTKIVPAMPKNTGSGERFRRIMWRESP